MKFATIIKNSYYFSFLGIILGFFLLPIDQLHSQKLQSIPSLDRRVTDLAGILPTRTISQLENDLKDLEEAKGSQMAILIVTSTLSEEIEEYSIRVVDKWKLGRKGVDDGLLLLVAYNDRKVRIEIGYGLEGLIPDVIAKRIIDQIIVPEFKKRDYEKGIKNATEVLIQIIRTEEIPDSLKSDPIFRGVSPEDELVILLIFGGLGSVFFIIGMIILFRSNVVLAITLSVIAALGIIIFMVAFQSMFAGLAFGLFVSGIVSFITGIGSSSGGMYSSGSGYSSGYSGGYSGSYGGSSGGGGFSGGGGSFGGGGSSGSW
ncbi:MAG: TPM domain-containing protein [Leptospira sp.]|nr:TPM domain-containing protein [Leptospira sp.]